MSIRTLALQITPENLPIVQAILPIGFLNVPPATVIGCYLVLNEIELQYETHRGSRVTGTQFKTAYYTEEQFFDFYSVVPDGYNHNGFFEVDIAVSR